ncbi:efflux RND transporter permease subunit [Reichenbachiella versicolor]|uniref:efflux RND transporter permease subunit n=1 Tax=Reichenbachiella versicolor TaxID=1821036 RepID=UPI000D6E9A64|nr:efflux RND transporter permease subunit [Reichenbachiella versicolor]
MKNKGSAIEWAMENKAFPLALVSVLLIIGVLAFFNMSRNEFPQFTIRQGVVVGFYPGASSEQVEAQLSSKVEEFLFRYNEVNKSKTYSYSKDGIMFLFVEVSENVGYNATKQFWSKLKNEILIFQQTSLPKEVLGVMVNSDFGNTAAMILTVESDSRSYKDLEDHVEEIEDELRNIPELAKISHSGGLSEQIAIYVDNNKLMQFGISPGMIMQTLQSYGATGTPGSLDGKNIDRPIHLETSITNETDLAQQIIRVDQDGNAIYLRDIATIKREYEKPSSYITTNGSKCMIITLEMVAGNNIVQFGEKIDEHLEAIEGRLPMDIKFTKIADQPKVVDHSIGHFLKEFGYALIGVILVTVLLLPFRIASVAGATIPITILATLAVMYMLGIELNTVTLAALIVVLGIVVDDPIVVIDNHVEKLDQGQSVWEAAKNSAKELFPSVFTATLAISAAFIPLIFFLTGLSSDFISAFPWTITIALFLSLIISVLLIPYINTIFVKKGLHSAGNEKGKRSFLDIMQDFFDKTVKSAVKHYRVTISLGVLSIILGMCIMGTLVPQQLFPTVDRDQFAIEITLAKGNNLDKTEKVVKRIEQILAKDERVVSYTSFIGESSPRFHTTYAPNLPAQNYAQIIINTTSDDATVEILNEYDVKYTDLMPEAYIRMRQLDMVSSPAPVEVRLYGQNMADLKKVGDQIIDLARSTPQATWCRTDFGDMQGSVKLKIREDVAARLGLNRKDISNMVVMNMDGINATEVWDGEYPINVKIKTSNTVSSDITNLGELMIGSPVTGTTVPLRQVAEVLPSWNQEQIVRRNGQRCLTVRIDIEKGAVANNVLGSLDAKIQKLDIPDNVKVEYGGELEMQNENLIPMGVSLLTSIIIIFLILLWHFKQLKPAVLSFLTMPLSIFGAALGLWLMDYPFGFTSFMGLLALCGIVVRNGIILIDFANEIRVEHGLSYMEAAIQAAQRRMRPIFLTSSAAAVGVIPMIASRSSLWGPLGTVIAFGLMMSMVLTLFVLPVLYWLFFRKDEIQKIDTHVN